MNMFSKDILLDFDEDIVLPFTNEWKKTYSFVVEKIEEYEKDSKELLTKLNKTLNTIIKNGEAYEDIVLKATMLYFLVKNTPESIEELEKAFSPTVIKNVKILLNDNSSKELDEIFLNKSYAYLNKIKLVEYIYMLKNIKNEDLVNKMKVLAKVDNVIKNYKTKTHKKLMNILIETRNKID